MPREYGEGHHYYLLHLLLAHNYQKIHVLAKFRATKFASQEIGRQNCHKSKLTCKRLNFFIGTNFKRGLHGDIFMNKNFPDENNFSKIKANKFKYILETFYLHYTEKMISRN